MKHGCCTGVVHSFDVWNAPKWSNAGVAARRNRGRGEARLIIDSVTLVYIVGLPQPLLLI